jgi:hypothetical protein
VSELWTFQVIRLDGLRVPLRVLEEGAVPRELVTRELAKEMLQDRCRGPSYRIKPAVKLRPEGIRFLDHNGEEALRYTVFDLRREGGTITTRKSNAHRT